MLMEPEYRRLQSTSTERNKMGLEKENSIDAIGRSVESEEVILTIFDSWDWKNRTKHLSSLEKKILSYIEFIYSGQIYDEYPVSKNTPLAIDLVHKYEIPPDMGYILHNAEKICKENNIRFYTRLV